MKKGIWIQPWMTYDYDSRRSWYNETYKIDFADLILGKPHFECAEERLENVLIPMPEGCYDAECTKMIRIWSYRFGFKEQVTSYDLEISAGIPFEGKGESEWDVGEDRLYSQSGLSVEKAIGNTVSYVLERRNRYGGIRLANIIITGNEQ